MLLLKALRHRPTFTLWIGQLGSAIGDQIHHVVFIWIISQTFGYQTGYYSSLQLMGSLVFGIWGYQWIKHWPSDVAIMRLDWIRAFLVLVPVFLFALDLPYLTALILCSLLVGGIGALFEPVLMQTIPRVAQNPEQRAAANGLMSTTFRLARFIGPAVVGAFSGWIPMMSFFVIDALSYAGSAASVQRLALPRAHAASPNPTNAEKFKLIREWLRSYHILRAQPPVFAALLAKSVTGGAWHLAYSICFALLAQEIHPGSVSTFGTMISVYGVGNIVGILWFGNIKRSKPERMIYQGLIWLGFTFAAIAITDSFPWMLLWIGLSAIGGPWNDLPFVDLAQEHFEHQSLGKVFLFKHVLETAWMLAMALISPFLIQAVSIRGAIGVCAGLMLLSGVWGFVLLKRRQAKNSV